MSKLATKLGQPMVRPSAKVFTSASIDESKTVVSGGGNATKSSISKKPEIVNISSDESAEEDEDDSDDSDNEVDQQNTDEGADVTMELDGGEAVQDEQEVGEPSFGDLARANITEPIDVATAFDNPSNALTYPSHTQIQAPSGASLGTVLTQSLKTNDVALLESCLHTVDQDVIRATILRLDSPLAGTLLQKLAERLHKRPGRAGTLMIWVQYTLVAHGGYLATQTDLMKKLKELNKVIDVRSRSLSSLLSLKGKLDMLEAQIELRRTMQNQGQRHDDEDDEEGIIYVEGEESDQEEVGGAHKVLRNGDLNDLSDDDSEMSEDMPTRNGVIEESEEESSDDNDLIDDEAEETDADSGDEDDVDHGNLDTDEDEESDDETATRPAKIQKTGGSFSKRK